MSAMATPAALAAAPVVGRVVKLVLSLAALGLLALVAGLAGIVALLGGAIAPSVPLGPPTNLGVVHPPASIVALDEQVAAGVPPLVACHVPAAILLSQQYIESGYDPTAVSAAGAEGIAQFEPGTWPAYALPVPPGGATPPTPWNPVDAAWGEARFLCAHGFAQTPTGALAAYNCGSASASCRAVSGRYAAEILDLARQIAAPRPTKGPAS